MKKPVDEEAHFRIDELVREIAAMKAAFAEAVAAMKADLHEALMAQKGPGMPQLAALEAKMDAMLAAFRAPVTRTGTLNLPSGPVSMTVREER